MIHNLLIVTSPDAPWPFEGFCDECYDPDFEDGSWITGKGFYPGQIQEIYDAYDEAHPTTQENRNQEES